MSKPENCAYWSNWSQQCFWCKPGYKLQGTQQCVKAASAQMTDGISCMHTSGQKGYLCSDHCVRVMHIHSLLNCTATQQWLLDNKKELNCMCSGLKEVHMDMDTGVKLEEL